MTARIMKKGVLIGAMKRAIATFLSLLMLVQLVPPEAVRASEAGPASMTISLSSTEPDPVEPPKDSDRLTVDWLKDRYSVSETEMMEQLVKGYNLTDMQQALRTKPDKPLATALSDINPLVEQQWEQAKETIEQIRLEDEQAQMISTNTAERAQLPSASTPKLVPGNQKSVSPARSVERIGDNGADGNSSARGMTTMADPPLPNLASNYDQAAAGLLNVRTDQAPYSVSNGSEQISTMTGELTIRNTDMTLPGRNGLSFSLDRVYNSSDAKYYEDNVSWRLYQRKWFFPVVNLYIEAVDANGIHHSSGLGFIPMFYQSQYVLFNNINWEFTPPAMFGFEYADESNLIRSAEQQMQGYINNTPWRGYRSAYGVTLYYYMFPTGQVVEIPFEHETLTQGYENKATTTVDAERRFPLGKGWSWDLSYIKTQNSKRYITISGVGTYEISGTNTLIGYPWKDLTFGPDNTVTVSGKSSTHVLKSISGFKQYFSADGKLIRQADNYGNTIDFQYANVSPYGEVLTRVTDALQNTINIAYTTTKVTITSGDRTVVYNKAQAPGNKEFLGSVTDAGGRTTHYGYRLDNTNFNLLGPGYADGENYSLLLTTVYHPTGATTNYTYASTRQQFGQQASGITWYVASREDVVDYIEGTQERANRVTFTHAGFPNSTYGINTTFSSTVNNGLTQKVFTYKKTFINPNTPAVFYNTNISERAGNATRTSSFVYDEVRRLPVPNQTTTQYTEGSSASPAVTTSASYDDYGNVLTSTDPYGTTTTYVYDPTTRLLKSATERVNASQSRYTEYTRNSQGSVTGITVRENNASGALKQRTSFGLDTYGNTNQVTIQDDNRNTVIQYEFGAQYKHGFPTKQSTAVTDVNGQASTIVQQMEYNPLTGQLTKLIDGKGYTTSVVYDKLGRVTRQVLPDGSQTNIVYDDVLNKVTVTDMLGRITETLYSPFGWLKYQTLLGGYSSYGYDAYGRQIWSEDAKRQRTAFQYDAWGRLTRSTNADNSFSQTQYNDIQLTKTSIDESNRALREVYDLGGRLLRVEEPKPSGAVVLSSQTYDLGGRVVSSRDAGNHATQYSYDVLDRLTAVTDPEGRTTRYGYSMSNNLTSVTYPDNHSRLKFYDEIGRLIRETDPSGQTEKYKYDANGNLIQSIDRKGRVKNLTYNNRNFLISSSTPQETISYTYDAEGKRRTMTDATGTTSYGYYDSTARLQGITYPDGTELQFDYDEQSLESRYIVGDSRVEYGYDVRNRVNSMLIQGSDRVEGDMWYVYEAGRIQHTFNLNSTLTRTTYNNGLFVKDYVYDGFNLSALSYKRSNQSVIGSFQYGYDNNRNIVSRNENGRTDSFTYDALQRIRTSSLRNETYEYDERGNRKTLVSDLAPTVPLGAYEYDDRDRLIKVVSPDGHEVRYRYNGDGLLYERLENGVTTRYYYDEQGNLFREGTVMPDGSVQLTARYIYGSAGGSPLARDNVASDVVLYYVNNGHGDVTAVVDGAGNLVNQYQYDIWGNPVETTELLSTPFRYSGEYWDDSTGLQYLRARWYDPSVGRFINEDSYQGTLSNPLSQNLYTYVENNPLIYTDPTGHYCVSNDGNWAHGGKCSSPSGSTYLGEDKYLTGLPIIKNGYRVGILNVGATDPVAENYYKSSSYSYYISLVDRGVREDEQTWFIAELLMGMGGLTKSLAKKGATSTAKKTGTVWDSIKATQPVYEGTKIPRSFELTVGKQKFWVHGNATEHLAEFITRNATHGRNINTQALLTSFESAVKYATKKGIQYDELIQVGGWGLKFSAPRAEGQLPAIVHALLK